MGDPSSGDSGTSLHPPVWGIAWRSVSDCVCEKGFHMVLLRSVPVLNRSCVVIIVKLF